MTTVVVYAPDLMDRSRFDSLETQVELKFASQVTSLVDAEADVVIADLSRAGVLDALTGSKASRRLGFVSHVDAERRKQAQETGVEVYARSRFFSRLTEIITQSSNLVVDNEDDSTPT